MDKKITAAMIAEKAGVSPATMSRYLRQKTGVRSDSAKKIEAALSELGVTIEPKQSESSVRHPVIVVNIPGIINTFYGEIIRGIRASAQMHGCHVLIHESALHGGSIDTFCKMLKEIGAAGVILMSAAKKEFLDRIHSIAPLVQCSEVNETTDYPYVTIDNYLAAKNATEHLIACGCNKIALINSAPTFYYARKRQAGFQDAMLEAGNSTPANWLVQLPEIDYSLAYAAVCRLLSQDVRPNAIFAVSDIYAVAALRAANRFQIKIPQQLMVVGFDNLDLTAMTCPSITTVSQSSYQEGYSACELLVEQMEQPGFTPKSILVDTELITRESTSLGF